MDNILETLKNIEDPAKRRVAFIGILTKELKNNDKFPPIIDKNGNMILPFFYNII